MVLNNRNENAPDCFSSVKSFLFMMIFFKKMGLNFVPFLVAIKDEASNKKQPNDKSGHSD